MAKKVKKSKYYVGVDIGGTKIAVALVSVSGKIGAYQKAPVPSRGNSTEIFKCLKGLIEDVLVIQGVESANIKGIGVGVPGIVKPNHKDILKTPNIDLSKYPLAENLQKTFGVNVVIGNDVNLGLLGEKWQGVGRNANNIIGLFPGTGVGGAVIINGQLLCGAQGAAGELGHIIMDMSSKQQSAGLYGTLEALASRRAMERDIRGCMNNGEPSVIADLLEHEDDIIKSGILAQALNKKDRVTMAVVDRACMVLGQACVSMRHIFNPEMIILGGGVIEACGDYMILRIRQESDKSPFFKGIDDCHIEKFILGDDAVILGAVALFKQVAGEKISSKARYYPELSVDDASTIRVNKKTLTKNMYIRADGKEKKINGSDVFEELHSQKVLSSSAIRKICKKSPGSLIISSLKNDIKISEEGKAFLKERSIDWQLMTIKEAMPAYNQLTTRKSIVIYQS